MLKRRLSGDEDDDDERQPLLAPGDGGGDDGRGDLRQRSRRGGRVERVPAGVHGSPPGEGGAFRPVLSDPRTKGDPEFIPEQFRRHDERRCSSSRQWLPFLRSLPWRSLLLGAFLLCCGLWALGVLAADVLRGYDAEDEEEREFRERWRHVDDASVLKPAFVRRSERFWPLLFLGAVSFIPGSYVVGIAVLAAAGVPGFSFDDIPT